MIFKVWQNPSWLQFKENSVGKTTEKKFKASLIISIYNKIDDLSLILASCESQSLKDFEIIISDDGSRDEVTNKLKKDLSSSPLYIRHIWHKDQGFRKNRILNHSILQSQSNYLIFIDGDCVIHPEFIREHFENKKKKVVLSGRGIEMTPWLSKMLTVKKIKNKFIENNICWIVPAIIYQKENSGIKGIYFKSQWLRNIFNKRIRPIVGRNFSIHKEDLLSINGFNMNYEGPGIGEDSDIEYRLKLLGVHTQSVVNMAVQYHIYHPLLIRKNENYKIFDEVQKKKEAFTKYGIQELEKEVKANTEYAFKA